ncbi:MAG: transglycosylase SLT domain-containing protein, partial [Deltaproteobacteria bacterium]|nr:transglycosylase SLT domain-containing protein [Deltaproteobacteria bacterium]
TLALVLAAGALLLGAHAQPARAALVDDTADEASGPKFTTVEQLEQQLLADKTRRVPALFKAQDAINKKEWKKAIDAAKALESRVDYADYYHFLSGEAELGRMHKFMREGASATAMLAAEQAKFHLTQVATANPSTTLWKRANTMLGAAEITIGEIHVRAKRRAKGQQYLELGFQRLANTNQLVSVPKATIVSYALLCERSRNDLCVSWVSKLAPFVAKTEEARILERVSSRRKPYIDRTPSVPYKVDLDLQAFQKGFQQYLDGKYEDAYGTFRDLLRDYPRTTIKLRTKFWMGRSAQKSKHDAQAETLFREIIKELPFSYYALLASWFGNIDLSRMMDAELPVASSDTPLATPADIVHIRRAEALIASAAPELAVIELQDVHPSTSMSNEFLVYLVMLNHLAGNHQAAFQMLGELSSRSFQGLFSSYGQKLYFPMVRLPLIRDLSKEWNVDPLVVLSIIKQESAFNEEAASSANAYGLMQIIPPTARDLDPRVEVGDLLNPLVNIKLGSRYVRQLLNRYKGHIVPALAAYNAGPGHSDRWLREAPPTATPEEFIELIGFRETREYIQNILRNYFWYHRRVKGDSIPGLAALMQAISPNKGLPFPGAALKLNGRINTTARSQAHR